MSRYLVGIDLGTTNSALAFIDLEKRTGAKIEQFSVPQLVASGEVASRDLLPSFLYLPGPHDLPAGATSLPWDSSEGYRRRVCPQSRLANPRPAGHVGKVMVMPHGSGPFGAPLAVERTPEVSRISPVEVTARYLKHLADAWNLSHGQHRLEKQQVVLTVPASFDDVARQLTVEAATKAGIEHFTLLEEPQAAFYCWLATHAAGTGRAAEGRAAEVQPGDSCLVVDVGGGTTDFSLIQASEEKGELAFLRQAVGDHLLLGGDNMDLALAKYVETKLPQAGRLDAVQYGLLTQACRQAKETLLAENPPASYSVAVMGRGRAVIGGGPPHDADARRDSRPPARRLFSLCARGKRTAARRPRRPA